MSPNTSTLSSAEDLHPLVQQILKNQDRPKQLVGQLDSSYESVMHDPFLFEEMEACVDRVLSAVKDNQRIVVFADFDTDGIPAAAMWHDLFSTIGYENFEIYIPKRDVEGFGLKKNQVEEFLDNGADLIITVDCGIRSHEAVALAKEGGADVVITDHHVPAETNPEADVIINPTLPESDYPCEVLCGAGVTFKCLQAMEKEEGFELPENFSKGQLDMVAIATVSDMVPLVGENRALAYFGLKLLRQTNRPGLHALYQKGRIQGCELTEIDIGFTIGSHINAASRLDQPQLAFDLLVTRNHKQGKELARKLHNVYRKRKRKTKKLKVSVNQVVSGHSGESVVSAGSSEWKPALLGPIAHRLTEAYNSPVFLWGETAGRRKGSARAVNHNVVAMLQTVADTHLKMYGGHEMAGGFELKSSLPSDLDVALGKVVNQFQLETGNDTPQPVPAKLRDLSWSLHESLAALGPFGVGNPQPLFRVTDVQVTEVRRFGSDNEHVSFTVTDGGGDHEAVCFFASKKMKQVMVGQSITIVGALEKTTFGFKKKLRFRMERIIT